MEKKLPNLPIIDKNIDKIFTKNSNQALKELLGLFIRETPKLQAEIKLAYEKKQQKKLTDLLHKLQGSCIYCGFIRLKAFIVIMENEATKQSYSKETLKNFNREVETALAKAKEVTLS